MMTVHSVIDRTDHDGTPSALRVSDASRPTERLVITRVSVWSVVKLAIVFWSMFGALIIGALVALWAILSATGAVTNFERFITDLTGVQHFRIMSDTVLGALAIAIFLFTVVCIAITALVAVWLNALSSLVGGIEVDCAQVARRT